MDTDTNDIASNGFGNSLTRDGQGQPTANLPMAGFRHTGVQNAVNRSDYAAFGQVQDALSNWTIAGGSADAITATYTPALTGLNDGQLCNFRASAANATTTPTFAPNGLTARTITRSGGAALIVASTSSPFSDIPGNLAESILRYNAANTRWELLNPAGTSPSQGTSNTGDVKLTFSTTADPGWLLFDDGTYGSATSGSSNSNSALNQSLFTKMFNGVSDTNAPLLTSAGAGTTRAGQGTAAAAWAANCRMTLPKALGRALGVAGAGSGLTSRALGAIVGEETHLLTLGETPTGITSANTGSIGLSVTGNRLTSDPGGSATGGGTVLGVNTTASALVSTGTLGISSVSVTSNNTGGGAHNNMQPSSFLNAMVKQ